MMQFFSVDHTSLLIHFIQGQKCLKCFFEIKSLSKVLQKTASFLKHYDFSEMRYLIESGFWRHMILCDAKCSYYEHKNHTKYQFYRSNFQASDPLTDPPPSEKFGHFQGGDLYKISIRAAPAAGFLRRWILRSILLYEVYTWFKITNCNLDNCFHLK